MIFINHFFDYANLIWKYVPILLDSETAIFNIFKLINCKTFNKFFIKYVTYFL